MIVFKKLFFFTAFLFYTIESVATELVDVRSGKNENFDRIVLDFKDEVYFSYEINNYNILIIFDKKVSLNKSFNLNKNIVKSFYIDEYGKRLSIKIKENLIVKKLFKIDKVKNNFFRIVIDFYPKPLKKKIIEPKVIVIDPGHGGKDSGAIGKLKILEKNVTLEVAKKLNKKLNESSHFKSFLTRNSDKYINLRQRVNLARGYKADLFISLHADSNFKRNVRGVSIYTLSETASDKEAEALAKRENKSDLIDGLDLSVESKEVRNILIDLTQRETMNQSSNFVNYLINEFKKRTKLLQRTHRFAGFAVLKAPDIPSVLIEMGYLSNIKDAKLLISSDYHKKIVESISSSIESYFKIKTRIN